MQVSYKIFSKWRELDNVPEANNFMCYQIRTGGNVTKFVFLDF